MAWDWNFVPGLISAASGLAGVWLGGQLTSKREATREKERTGKELSYLAILVVAHLDRFVNCSVDVAFDDGTIEGLPAGHDRVYHESTVAAPKFDPLVLNVDWKVLPADLMYDVLNLPYQVEQLSKRISCVNEFDSPPDFVETFWERQLGYAVLGLEVAELASRLRRRAGLPSSERAEEGWDRESVLRAQRDKIAKEKAESEARTAL